MNKEIQKFEVYIVLFESNSGREYIMIETDNHEEALECFRNCRKKKKFEYDRNNSKFLILLGRNWKDEHMTEIKIVDLKRGKTTNVYHIEYKMQQHGEVFGVDLWAKNKADAYYKAHFEVIPKKEGSLPYSLWVDSVTYKNGKHKRFNTFEGKPY